MNAVTAQAPVLVMAGGTGGHVYPALAVADELTRREVPVVWLGTRKGLEARVVPAAGYPVEWIEVSGLRGKGVLKLLLAPLMLAHALYQAWRVMRRVRPRAVLGMGGFVTGPGGIMAWLSRRPLIIHEQNSVAGLTNRLLAPLAARVLVAFPGSFGARGPVRQVGNPVRETIASLEAPEARFAARGSEALHLLVLGGSLGAAALNRTVPAAIAEMAADARPMIRHQAGSRDIEAARQAYAEAGVAAEVQAFIEDMAQAYAWADLVICRAGALTVAELAAAGVGAILVPYPHAVDDHQTGNARYLSEAGAGVLVQQTELSVERLHALLAELLNDRRRLLAMARAARDLALPDAARRVADSCLELAAGRAA
ncbi:undecaprenyldiphospho-muramoylpentapeptide beta-N-acetylglucosaminyltransferase [Thiohalobacter thiocyanaticus]|uniref:UDP-N-acetylglucosamine--N-acetylmuramyl-(pentapeptide) pyrophosphoryl-undecaprenol N-acetylglucosamine transferase n=1 Tax=Thiohalobacter thiocyanaticus TaxID=585455 RepID=A0A426QL82_9GAMM|nr:undecaprenyldiphospho-muramoylpentapeptide beta-N-acetylglucosaminyltransferase [Thiohalobacter thiocyanaticus]RRQ22512.1 undecaprenyldiphospho-muramoylpentapeptide beta-N-acetylglucosaminyltransferase [Thiohalobacter thiocyanaticus]